MTLIYLAILTLILALIGLAILALILKTAGLAAPVLDGLINSVDNLRLVLKTAMLDMVQINRAREQSQIDIAAAQSAQERDSEMDSIKIMLLRDKAELEPQVSLLRLTRAIQTERVKRRIGAK